MLPDKIELSTRRGTAIDNEVGLPTDPVIGDIRARVLRSTLPPGAKELFPFDSTFNCMGHVFGARRAEVHPREFEKISLGDDYVQIPESQVRVGDIVAYFDERGPEPEHVGVIVAVSSLNQSGLPGLTVHSKFGYHGEFIHPVMSVPRSYGLPSYWRVSR